jgi:predicted nucleic acid-binding protein
MTTGRQFLDTNVLVYAHDADAGTKAERAREIILRALEERSGVVSSQVLGEYFVVATRKLGVAAEVAHRQVELLSNLDVVPIGHDDVLEAIKLHRLRGLHYWDAMILRCAVKAGCSQLLTEDLQAGSTVDGVQVVNPFT